MDMNKRENRVNDKDFESGVWRVDLKKKNSMNIKDLYWKMKIT